VNGEEQDLQQEEWSTVLRKRKRSKIWEHILINDNHTSLRCRYCEQQYVYRNGSTTNMRVHLCIHLGSSWLKKETVHVTEQQEKPSECHGSAIETTGSPHQLAVYMVIRDLLPNDERRIQTDFEKRWFPLPLNYHLMSLLDPRMKALSYLSPLEQENVWQLLQQEMDKLGGTQPTQEQPHFSPNSKATNLLRQMVSATRFPQHSDKSELAQYRLQAPLVENGSPFDWWRVNKAKFPILARLARIHLAIPATSVPAERLFSCGGNVISKKRSRLTSTNATMLISLHFNAKWWVIKTRQNDSYPECFIL